MDQHGWVKVTDRFIKFPFVGACHFTDHRDLLIDDTNSETLTTIHKYLQSNRHNYARFIRQKGRHPSIDIYACFQPFNEAFKCLYPFVAYLRSLLKPGDIVLNLWDRSLWTGAMLAGWLPEQEIWTVWEGDKDILGYRGFDYWTTMQFRHQHKIFFADLTRPLPFASSSVAAVIGFDLLHRFNQPDLLNEIHRVATPSSPILFPHVHLTNNFPDPFFERGCRQLHGKDYEYFFRSIKETTTRKAYILSEPATFWNNDFGTGESVNLASTPDHRDYNGCIAWLDPDTAPFLKPWRGYEDDWTSGYLLQNPFLNIDPVHHRIEWNTSLYGNQIEDLLGRHFIYKQRITPSIGKSVPMEWEQFFHWAAEGKTIADILSVTGMSVEYMKTFLTECWLLDLAQAIPVDHSAFRLQTLLGQQKYIPANRENNLETFWRQSVSWYGDEVWMRTNEELLTYQQANELIELTKKSLYAEGLRKGDKILICTFIHYESVLMFWAAVSLGIVVVPVSPKDSPEKLHAHLEIMRPSMVLADPCVYDVFNELMTIHVIMTDLPMEKSYDSRVSFEAFLSRHVDDEIIEFPKPEGEDISVILSTTGSTGNPKSIPLTHAQLIRSGRLMTETYLWKKGDRYLAIGGLETMSGLRQVTVCIAESGAGFTMVKKEDTIHDHYQTIINQQITILTANPTYFRQLLFAFHAASGTASKWPVKIALSTGNGLPALLRKDWHLKTGTPLLNYYGLTETSGICIAETPGFAYKDENSIGIPVGCLVKIVDEQDHEVRPGNAGELCIYGAGVFSGYYENETASRKALVRGWFHTKDLAIKLTDGSISLSGRMSDIIKLPSGERIELSAIDEILNDLAFLSDWATCPVTEHDKESVALFIVLKSNENNYDVTDVIKKMITGKIGSYAVPKYIEVVSNIPRGSHGKVLRAELLKNKNQIPA
jgi:acyl-coenzyme A synthetase/AMP-(fatty) acid ligase